MGLQGQQPPLGEGVSRTQSGGLLGGTVVWTALGTIMEDLKDLAL